MPELRILGVDPGSLRCGYGVIGIHGTALEVLDYGVLQLGDSSVALGERLRCLFEGLRRILRQHSPAEAAVESTFYARDAQALAKLAAARGVVLLALALSRIPVAEYAPRQVKQAVTGRGGASKQQVQYMVRTVLGIGETPAFFDATDALAVALCHAFRRGQPMQRSRSWEEFLREHPERIWTPPGTP
jgi:crossover junction endodeoxyribonuclease RuvC